MMVARDPRPGDYVVFGRDLTVPVGLFGSRTLAVEGQVGVVRAVRGGILSSVTATVVMLGDGREVETPASRVTVHTTSPVARVVAVTASR